MSSQPSTATPSPQNLQLSRLPLQSISIISSLILLLLISVVWYRLFNSNEAVSNQLSSQSDVNTYWEQYGKKNPSGAPTAPIKLPTGVFIQTFRFDDANTVNLTGYVWNRYTNEIPEAVRGRPPLFPEAVDVSDMTFTDIYSRTDGPNPVQVWSFDVTVRQQFDYTRYPLDRQKLWLRMQPPTFDDSQLILLPDLGSYADTDPAIAFGYNKGMDPGSWDIINSFFNYMEVRYDSDFGMGKSSKLREHAPELAFNLILRRNIFDGFMINVIPLLVIFLLLFATVVMISPDPERSERFGLDTAGALGVCSGIFFVIIVAHVQLRGQFPGSPIIYLEYFYLLAYVSTLVVALNAYLASANEGRASRLIRYGDNLLPKLLFWPVTLALLLIITVLMSMQLLA